jgi:hypothetical protein
MRLNKTIAAAALTTCLLVSGVRGQEQYPIGHPANPMSPLVYYSSMDTTQNENRPVAYWAIYPIVGFSLVSSVILIIPVLRDYARNRKKRD